MPSLAEIQLMIRDEVVAGESTGIGRLLIGGESRFDIHRRHYEISLVSAVTGKFPATSWLVGDSFVTEAARRYVHQHPPHAPCIAEYGERFPEFLAQCPGAERVSYLTDFARLEWHIGHISIAVDESAVPPNGLASIPAGSLPDIRMSLQSGLRYVEASWPVDSLMTLYLTDTAPDRLELVPEPVWLELRGARGEFNINRLPHPEFIFRKLLAEQCSLGEAAQWAYESGEAFDPGQALAAILAEGLITAFEHFVEEA